jgi:hypothetical protein
VNKFLKALTNTEIFGVCLFITLLIRFVFLKTTDENEFTINLYFLIERIIELQACVIAFNCISSQYYRIALPACAIALMSFINELLHLFNIIELNNGYLLTFEFLILLIILWLISKHYYTSS